MRIESINAAEDRHLSREQFRRATVRLWRNGRDMSAAEFGKALLDALAREWESEKKDKKPEVNYENMG